MLATTMRLSSAIPQRWKQRNRESVIAPGGSVQHNETFVSAPATLEAEELEAIIVPGNFINHNDTFLR